MLHPWLGDGLITSSGLKWFKHRKMITPAFHFKILQKYRTAMNESSTKFIEKLYKASEGETIFDFQEMVRNFTMDVLCGIYNCDKLLYLIGVVYNLDGFYFYFSDTTMGVHINAMDNNDAEMVTAFK